MKINKKRITTILFIGLTFLMLKPCGVSAEIVFNEEDDDGAFAFSNGLTMSIPDYVGGSAWRMVITGDYGVVSFSDVYASAGVVGSNGTITIEDDGTADSISTASYNNETFCVSDKRIPNFCEDLETKCGTSTDWRDGCRKAIAEIYDEKMETILKAELDSTISEAGVDVSKGNTAIEACAGNLVCINDVLEYLKSDPSFLEGSTPDNSGNGPLTANQLSDLINTNSNPGQAADVQITPLDLGPLNSANNQAGGMANKQQSPAVSVNFSGGPSQAGSSMTANAIPSFFNNASDPKKLYFTWYLKRQACELTDPDKKDSNKKETNATILANCDLDKNEKITENDWKIAAAEIIVGKGFDKTGVDYGAEIDEDLAGFKAFPSPKKDEDENGWQRNSGEDENDDNAPNCYVHEGKSGLDYELRKVKPVFNGCPADYHRSCVSDLPTSTCSVLNPAYDQVAANAMVPPAVYDIPKTIVGNIGGVCINAQENPGQNISEALQLCKVTDSKNFEAEIDCRASGQTAVCVKDAGDTIFPESASEGSPAKGAIFSVTSGNTEVCTSIFKPNENKANPPAIPMLPPVPPILGEKFKIFYTPATTTKPVVTIEGQTCATTKARMTDIVNGNPSLNPTCTFEKDANMCKHLFPEVPGDVTGDGKFTVNEKKFWGANPVTPSTNGIQKDEEAIVGLGVDKFEWMFSIGDQVGVVVEGDSAFSTLHADSSFKRTWAFSRGVCSELEDLGGDNNSQNGFYKEGEGGGSTGFLTTEIDLNDCLAENLLDPDENGNSELKINLTATPTSPINDSNGRGDILTVSSFAANLQNPDGLVYEWTVQKSRDGSAAPIDTTNWTDAVATTAAMIEEEAFSEAATMGLGKKDLEINLKLSDDFIERSLIGEYNGVFYLKVKAKITGTAADGSQNATGEVIVRVIQQENEIHVYPVTVEPDMMLGLSSTESLEFCDEQWEKTTCYVSKNTILGLEVPDMGSSELANFEWTVNGTPITCSETMSSECAPGGNKMFIPALGSVGEAVDIVATAIKTDRDGKTEYIEVSRHFVISQTELQITALAEDPANVCSLECLKTNSACQKYLGAYRDLSGAAYPDCSLQVWETSEGKTVTLNTQGRTGLDWSIDGQIMSEYKDQGQIELSIDKVSGESYNIGLFTSLREGDRIQLNNIRRALFKHWGVSPEEEIIAENQNASIQLDVVTGFPETMAVSKANFFGASLITHLPEQLMFLFKLSLTSVLMFLAISLLFAFIPETLFKERR